MYTGVPGEPVLSTPDPDGALVHYSTQLILVPLGWHKPFSIRTRDYPFDLSGRTYRLGYVGGGAFSLILAPDDPEGVCALSSSLAIITTTLPILQEQKRCLTKMVLPELPHLCPKGKLPISEPFWHESFPQHRGELISSTVR